MSKAKVIRNTFVIFLLSGFWHGANWTFIAWGAYHAVLFLPLILTGKNRKYTNQIAEGRLLPTLKEAGQMLLTFFLAVFGWIIFRAESIGMAWEYVCEMCNGSMFTVPWLINRDYYIPTFVAVLLLLLTEWVSRAKQHGLSVENCSVVFRWIFYSAIVILIIYEGGQPAPFVYFQF